MTFQVTAVIGVNGAFDDEAVSGICSTLDRILRAEPSTKSVVDFSRARNVSFLALGTLVQHARKRGM